MPHYDRAMRPQEVLDYEDQDVLDNAGRVFAIFDKAQIDVGSTYAHLKTLAHGYPFEDEEEEKARVKVRSDQPFSEQPTAQWRYGTAFLVARDIVATAKHVLPAIEPDVTEARFVRFFAKGRELSGGGYTYRDVFRGVEMLAEAEGELREDWALIRIDPPVLPPVTPVSPAMGPPMIGMPVYCLGHPMGLPMKLTYGKIHKRVQSEFGLKFKAQMDTYSGNSGSPVFCARTHRVVGILSAGGTDYENEVVVTVNDAEAGENILDARPMFEALKNL